VGLFITGSSDCHQENIFSRSASMPLAEGACALSCDKILLTSPCFHAFMALWAFLRRVWKSGVLLGVDIEKNKN
jgi:hypothetical protein